MYEKIQFRGFKLEFPADGPAIKSGDGTEWLPLSTSITCCTDPDNANLENVFTLMTRNDVRMMKVVGGRVRNPKIYFTPVAMEETVDPAGVRNPGYAIRRKQWFDLQRLEYNDATKQLPLYGFKWFIGATSANYYGYAIATGYFALRRRVGDALAQAGEENYVEP